MLLFFEWYAELMRKCFDVLNQIVFTYHNDSIGVTYTIHYGWILVAFLILTIISSIFWKGARK